MAEATVPTWTGVVRSIHVAPEPGAPTLAQDQAHAVAGAGLEGDRHAGTPAARPRRQVTLVEAEALEAARRDYGLELGDGDARRNIVTAGVPLNHLVGREFTVGEVRLRGTGLCEPCGHLQDVTEQPVVRALRHRGGLCAVVLTSGTIRPGDRITPA